MGVFRQMKGVFDDGVLKNVADKPHHLPPSGGLILTHIFLPFSGRENWRSRGKRTSIPRPLPPEGGREAIFRSFWAVSRLKTEKKRSFPRPRAEAGGGLAGEETVKMSVHRNIF